MEGIAARAFTGLTGHRVLKLRGGSPDRTGWNDEAISL